MVSLATSIICFISLSDFKSAFVNTINILLTRFSEIPEGVIKEMQKTVKDLFPNWRKNFLLNYYILEKKKVFLPLIDYPFERGDNREVTNVLKFVATKYFQT